MKSNGAPLPVYIDSAGELDALYRELDTASWLAIDTEFMREKTYYAQLCLIQVATPNLVACVDPLAIADLSPLYELFARPDIVKVLHSCHQDMEILYQTWGRLPEPVFDTQVAAPLLGYPAQMGYARLVGELLGVELEKGQTRSDWSRRPLSRAQLDYAADDVLYLGQVYERMLDALDKKNRLDWLEEDFARLSLPDRYEQLPENAWQRIRNVQRLRPRQINVLKALAEWRETTARKRDVPRNWILRDEVLVEMAMKTPADTDALAGIRGLAEKTLERHGGRLLTLIQNGLAQPPQSSPASSPRGPKLDEKEQARLDRMLGIVEQRAKDHDIPSAVLASKKELTRLLLGQRDVDVLGGWRKSIVGNDLLEYLNTLS